MEKIRCPHCGAVNQDVTPEENCWQCGKRLGSAPASTEASGEANGAGPPVKQVSKPTIEERVAARKAARKRSNLTPYIVLVLLIFVALIAFLITKR